MIINSDTSGAEFLRLRLDEAKILFPGLLVDAAKLAGDTVAEELGAAAPVGEGGGGSNPPGDAEGRLNESFACTAEAQGSGAKALVTTNQPQKLKYVTEGRGEILPVVKLALMWQGLPHPVKRAGPAAANDFVTPVIDSAPDIVEPEITATIDVLGAILGGV